MQPTGKRLFELLDEGVFQPVLQTSESQLPRDKQFKLPQVKRAVAEQRESFGNCASDEELYQLYHEQLGTGDTDRLNHELRELNMPVLTDCSDQLEQAATALFEEGRR
jgi:hypothetical protein